jgi:hypothetical protein
MIRVRTMAVIAAVVSLTCVSVALASSTKVTGGTAQVTASSAAAKLLGDNHITVTPTAPATASGATTTFPISGGALNLKNLHGVIRLTGGLGLSNGTQTVKVRGVTVVSNKHGASIFALVRGRTAKVCHAVGKHRLRVRCVVITRWSARKILTLTGGKVTGGTATATAKITAFTASVVNGLAGKQIVSAGAPLGAASITPTFK